MREESETALPSTAETDLETCRRFAAQHKVIFEDEGECGFGRECVGFLTRWGTYLEHNPADASDNYRPREDLQCPVARPGPQAPNAYHKHDCLAVLGRGAGAVAQLAGWVHQMEAAGTVSVVDYATGNEGVAALLNGVFASAVMIAEEPASS